ncbi:hypothetical protein TNCV_208901 [Trichonephila clavipes]|uniref:Uncharacterized protein n=1 Tax=Trichonephila clavipes TaxID=2585209 RepID=A0A8X6VRY1_TRICX|nr:hypothetical protein TNCV_208901 [Trichonephila clavipes]
MPPECFSIVGFPVLIYNTISQMERVPKSPVKLRCRMERGDVLPAGFSSDDSLNSMIVLSRDQPIDLYGRSRTPRVQCRC